MSGPSQSLSYLLRLSGVRPLETTGQDPQIRGAALDSRLIEPGAVFFAIRGATADGLRHVPEAIERGAKAVVATEPRPSWLAPEIAWIQVAEARHAAALISRECYGRPDETLTLVGITGTNGKTTVAYLLESIARAAGRNAGRIGTVGSSFSGIERSLARTTPESPELYRLLADMRDHGVEIAAMEVSSHAMALERVAGARFAAAVFLNLGEDHLDFHGDREAYFAAKARLFDGIGPGQTAVLPADSPRGAELARRVRGRVITFGRSETADVRLTKEHGDLSGTSAVLLTPAGALSVRTRLLGGFNLDNVAAAAAAALALDLPASSIADGVLRLAGVPGRMEPIACGQPFTVLVDYAHTEAALAHVLGWLRKVSPGRVLVAFGCGGDRDVGKRRAMGRVAGQYADVVVLTSDNPRSEYPERILQQIAAGIESAPTRTTVVHQILSRREAIRLALAEARPHDVVVLAGKGHETLQVHAGGTVPFDDRSVVRELLGELGWHGGDHAGA